MLKVVSGLLFFWCSSCFCAVPVDSFNVNLDGVRLSEFVRVVMGDILKSSYMFEPDFQDSPDLISVHLRNTSAQTLSEVVEGILVQRGYVVVVKNGVFTVHQLSAKVDDRVLIYRPRYRSAAYLSNLLSSVAPAVSLTKKGISLNAGSPSQSVTPSVVSSVGQSGGAPGGQASSGSGTAIIDTAYVDQVVMLVNPQYYDLVFGLLKELDSEVQEVKISAAVYEVSFNRSDGSGLSLVASLLGGRLGLNLGSANLAGAESLSFGSNGLAFVMQKLDGDVRFRSVSKPMVFVKSGATSSFSVGQQVPVLGASSISGTGLAQQSVTYMQSGVVFSVTPDIHQSAIDLDVNQTISSFSVTTTGVNGSPTLDQRALKSSLVLHDGELIAVGGLDVDSSQVSVNRSFFHVFDSGQSQVINSSIVVFLQVDLVK